MHRSRRGARKHEEATTKRYLTDKERTFESSTLIPLPAIMSPEMSLVKVYPDITYQYFAGFGAALTESAGYVFSQMDQATQERFLDLCFSEQHNHYGLCRLSIQSCDFSLTPRPYMRKNDRSLASFSIDDDWGYVLPLVKAAQEINPNLEFIAAPWSPPSWAKTTHMMKCGGHLRKGAYETWARMIARTLVEYRNAGVDIGRITIQNEPMAIQPWESCIYTAEEERDFLHGYLKPALREAGLGQVKTLIWDHNKERMLDRAHAIMTDEAYREDVDGVAFHWYSGDHFEALRATRDFIGPQKELVFSEGCDFYSEGSDWWQIPHAEHYAHEIIGDFEAGANAVLDWNILLDAKGGPNHVDNFCDAPIMYDTEERALNVRRPFHYLGHFSHFIQKGAKRMLVTRYTADLETCGFVNPDGSHVLIVLNRTEKPVDFDLTWGSGKIDTRVVSVTAPERSIQTITW